MTWTEETMQMVNRLTPDIHGKAFDPDWFLLRQWFEQLENGAKQIAKALATVDREAAELLERDDCEIECEEVREMCRDALGVAHKLGLLEDKR